MIYPNNGNLIANGDVTLGNLVGSTGAYEMVVANSTNGKLYKMDMNNIVHPWTVEATNGEAHRNSNVGIGDFTSTAPSYPLDVLRTNSDGNSAYFQGNVTAYSNLLVGGKLGIGISNPLSPLDINTSTDNIAVYITNNTTSSGSNPGDVKLAIFGNSYGAGSADNIGGEFHAEGAGTGSFAGVKGYADGVSSTTNFGVLGESKGNNTVLNIGVYGKATLGQNNWAGYFAEGDVKIENKLVLNKVVGQTDNTYSFPTTRGSDGQVLSMSSTPGQLEWTTPYSGNSLWTGVDTDSDGSIDVAQTSYDVVVNGGIATIGTESNHFNGNTTFNDTVNVFGADLLLKKYLFLEHLEVI